MQLYSSISHICSECIINYHRQCWIFLVVNSDTTDLASGLGAINLAKRPHIAQIYQKIACKVYDALQRGR